MAVGREFTDFDGIFKINAWYYRHSPRKWSTGAFFGSFSFPLS